MRLNASTSLIEKVIQNDQLNNLQNTKRRIK